jgi:hypothetical protein
VKRLPFAERLIGSIQRECLNHVVVLGEQHLRRTLARYFAYYHGARTHLSLDKDAPYGGQLSSRNSRGHPDSRSRWPPHIATSDGRLDPAQPVHDARQPRVRPLSADLGFLSFRRSHGARPQAVGCATSDPLSSVPERALACHQSAGHGQPNGMRFWRRTGNDWNTSVFGSGH